ncbi:ubiquitin carboxyl-terminal hydrolase 14 [Gloeopeniophorella convolvens]|nr:ubiquitin carboxyl-terminal hydrolase 14 [Gloeopeniophorella convolvens]
MATIDSAALALLKPPTVAQSVHREECTQCFDNQDDPRGIDVCLACFNGGCLSDARHHARTHYEKTGHALTLNIQRRPRPKPPRSEDAEPPAKMTKLAIAAEREEDAYTHALALRDWRSGAFAPADAVPAARALVDALMRAPTSARRAEVQAWEEELLPCEHTLTLAQHAAGPIPASGLASCAQCELKENLWLCLACGALGCGRKLYTGAGGNGHALAHFEASGHPVCVKLGTITPEGAADIHCYACDDSKVDPELAAHLAAFGINVAAQKKTERSTTELQIEHNLNYDFSLTDESGNALEPVSGPGLTGLQNLGNSCYMASVLQVLFALPRFQARWGAPRAPQHWAACAEPLPAACLACQLHKLADGLLSGRYARPPTPGAVQAGVRPASFKALVGRGHAEFATMRQQDAEEFLAHLVTSLRRYARAHPQDPGAEETFGFALEQRLQCTACGGVRYRVDAHDAFGVPVPAREEAADAEGRTRYAPVALEECLALATAPEALEYRCSRCARDVSATRQTRFATFPETLVLHAKKFQLVNWVPTKLDIPLVLPDDDTLTLDAYLGHGPQPGEDALPEDDAPPVAAEPPVDADALAQLEGMGFPRARCERALRATSGQGAEAAMEWLLTHMDDPDIDAPAAGASNVPASEEQVALLADMGFSRAQAGKALRETGGDPERAIEWLFSHPDDTGAEDAPAAAAVEKAGSAVPGSAALPARFRLRAFVSHKGPSVHSGHYVAHVRTDAHGWVLFNDEKVVRADAESVRVLKGLAYLYVFERVLE